MESRYVVSSYARLPCEQNGQLFPSFKSLNSSLTTIDMCFSHPSLKLFCLWTAFYIPPKQAQALLQGGTFVFDGPKTLFAHYDPSTAAHASIDRVLEIVQNATLVKTTNAMASLD